MKLLFKIISKLEYKLYDLKGYFHMKQFKRCGFNIKFYGNISVKNPHNISIGNNVTFNDGAYLNGLGGIEVGNNVSISALAIIVSTSLDVSTINRTKQHINKKIVIGNNVQIGAGAIVLSGITVGDNIVVGAGSVVTKNIESNSIVAGNPAKIIRKLN